MPALARREVVLSTPVGNAVGRIFGCRSIIGRCDHDRKELSSLLVGYSPSTTAPDRNDALARPSATSPPIATPDGKEHSHPPGRCPQTSHTVASRMRRLPHAAVGRRLKTRPYRPAWSGGKTEALPGRPRGAGLIHCVCGTCPDRQGTGATRVPLGCADLDRPGEVRGAFLFAVMSTRCPHRCPQAHVGRAVSCSVAFGAVRAVRDQTDAKSLLWTS